jgi:hypothetical protein
MIAFTSNDNEVAKWWLQREMLKDWAAVLTQEDAIPNYEDWKLRQLEDFLAEGWEVGMVIDTNERVIERAALLGIMGMRLTYPLYRPGFRVPEEAPRAWGSIVDSS